MTTKPVDCALALAIPLTAEDFYQGLQPGAQKDFAKLWARENPHYREDYLWPSYLPVMKLVEQVLKTVRARGVNVVKNVTLDQFSDLLKRFQVVTLVAHWRSAEFLESDFLAPQQLMNEVLVSTDDFISQLRSVLPPVWCDRAKTLLRQPVSAKALASLLQEGFTHILDCAQLYPTPTATLEITLMSYTDGYRRFLNRNVLDEHFVNKIARGNRIEFADCLHPIEEVIQSIPENYGGTIDFAVCNSIFLGDLIKRKRKCIVLVNTLPARPLLRLPIYQAIIDLIAIKDMEYVQADIKIRKELFNDVHNLKGNDNA